MDGIKIRHITSGPNGYRANKNLKIWRFEDLKMIKFRHAFSSRLLVTPSRHDLNPASGCPPGVRCQIYKMKTVFILLLISTCLGCKPSNKDKLLEQALLIIETNSLNRKFINWKEYKAKVYLKAGQINSNEERYRVIDYALGLLNDHHSFYIRPYVKNEKLIPRHGNKLSEWRLINKNIGYIQIPSCLGSDKYLLEYSSEIRKSILELDKHQLDGWIIDLRENVGGYLPAMLVGMGPLLTEGIQFYSVFPNGRLMPWIYNRGVFYKGIKEEMKENHPYHMRNKDKKIAVLINGTTGSAGEFVAICLRENKRSRLFGTKTFGIPTDNKAFCLSDSSWIVLTVAKMADLKKKIHEGPIIPDEACPYCNTNELIGLAKDWIRRN
jgi:carboxyl-terminal processing protease